MDERLRLAMRSLTVFRRVLGDPVMAKLLALLDAADANTDEQIARYADFAAALMDAGGDLSAYVAALTLDDENAAVRRIAAGQSIGATMQACIGSELAVLSDIAQLSAADVASFIRYGGYLPSWDNSGVDLESLYAQHLKDVATKGFGMWARHHMFTVQQDGEIVPVRIPDPIQLDDLKEYEYQRGRVADNTLALLRGLPAANTLLYGDAGTGKSSTVKALVNAYHGDGLRLVEMGKHQCRMIPGVVETLRTLPLKFILFFDDLSFSEENDAFYALKSALEGSASVSAPNVVIYATSNRRHLVKETFSDRAGDDVHRNETIQELCALSRRFGLTVGFLRPNKAVYLSIVRALAADAGIDMDENELAIQAEAFADTGRSPRMAQQFVAQLVRARQGGGDVCEK